MHRTSRWIIGRGKLPLLLICGFIGLPLSACGDAATVAETTPGTVETGPALAPETAQTTPPSRPPATETVATATAPPQTTTVGNANPGGASPTPNEERQPGGAGDEEAPRVPATFTIGRDGISPEQVSVPAFLTVALEVRSADGKSHTVTVAGTTVTVPASGSATKDLTGLKDGRYALGVDGAASTAALVAGAEPGP